MWELTCAWQRSLQLNVVSPQQGSSSCHRAFYGPCASLTPLNRRFSTTVAAIVRSRGRPISNGSLSDTPGNTRQVLLPSKDFC